MLSTKHVVLGLLIERSGYGYELQQRIEQRFQFLGLSETAIYRTLDRLERDGFIVEAGPKPAGQTKRGSPRVMYTATDDGVSEFRHWMAAPHPQPVLRETLHAKLVLAERDDLEQLIALMVEQERECLAALNALTRAPVSDAADATLPWPEVAGMLVDDARATHLQGTIDWLQRVRAVLERRIAGPRPSRRQLGA